MSTCMLTEADTECLRRCLSLYTKSKSTKCGDERLSLARESARLHHAQAFLWCWDLNSGPRVSEAGSSSSEASH